MALRYYQAEAVKAVLNSLKQGDCNPCVEIPTGGGKTPIIATIANVLATAGARVLIVAHRKELLQQTAEKLQTWAKGIPYTIVSAGLGQKDYDGQIVVAGVQSVYKNVDKLNVNKPINFLIVDEAHLIPSTEENAEGMYQTLIGNLRKYYPKLKVIGLTATPYRMNSGKVVGDDKILNKIVYNIGVKELIDKQYLSPLKSRMPSSEVNYDNIRVERGDFKTSDLDAEFSNDRIVHDAVSNIIAMTKERKSVLLFCCSVDHCKKVVEELRNQLRDKESVEMVTGETPSSERDEYLRRFKGDLQQTLMGDREKPIRYLANVDVLTTGFDATNVDCVVLLRPTLSPGLYYQMVGRGFRLHEGKVDCLVLDFAGNIERHGAVDDLQEPTEKVKKNGECKQKKCPRCLSAIPNGCKICPECGTPIFAEDFECPQCHELNDNRANFCWNCGYQIREVVVKHNTQAEMNLDIISGGAMPDITEEIDHAEYTEHTSKKSGKTTLRVDYVTKLNNKISEFVCFNHEGFARRKAEDWWRRRSSILPVPVSVNQAYTIVMAGHVACPDKIVYKPKKPGAYGPEIVSTIVSQQPLANTYPRTDNPLGLVCDCGCESFIYLNPQKGKFVVKCAKCGAETDVSGEEEGITKTYQVEFYNPNKGFEDFYEDSSSSDDDWQESFGATYSNNEDDIPF